MNNEPTQVSDHTSDPILSISGGLRVISGSTAYEIPSMRLYAGQWIVFVPIDADPATNPAAGLARCITSLLSPARGTIKIFGNNIYNISYKSMQRLRAQLGFVQGFGGLLSNQTIRANIDLPVSVHARRNIESEKRLVDEQLEKFSLMAVADEKPHLLDGFTKWRACLARALILKPKYVVLEGIGDWSLDSGNGIAWRQLTDYHKQNDNLICICAARRNKGFEAWFKENGGIVIGYADTKTTREYSE